MLEPKRALRPWPGRPYRNLLQLYRKKFFSHHMNPWKFFERGKHFVSGTNRRKFSNDKFFGAEICSSNAQTFSRISGCRNLGGRVASAYGTFFFPGFWRRVRVEGALLCNSQKVLCMVTTFPKSFEWKFFESFFLGKKFSQFKKGLGTCVVWKKFFTYNSC